MNKKRCSVILISLILTSFLIGIVAAAPVTPGGSTFPDLMKSFIETVAETLKPLAVYVLGVSPDVKTDKLDGLLFARVLFFLLVLSIVWLALNQVEFFSNEGWTHWIISIVVAILSIRFIVDDAWITFMLLSHEALGVTIVAGLPFAIYFIIVEVGMKSQPPIVRRTAWIFFAVVFLGLWASQTKELTGNTIWVYPVTIILSIAMAILDGTINRFFAKVDMERSRTTSKKESMRSLKDKQHILDRQLVRGTITSVDYQTETRRINNLMRSMMKGK